MKILFLARHYTYFRNFEDAIRLLAARGHRVHLAADREDHRALADRLATECDGVTVGATPLVPETPSRQVGAALRLGLDALQYEEDRYRDAPRIRQRAEERAPAAARWASHRFGRERADAWLQALARAVPPPEEVDAFLRAQAPDLVLLTPLIELGAPQLDYLRAARRLGVPTALAVWSWDHLTSKARIRVMPDRVLVWNDTQRGEAQGLHGVPADRIVVTGAQNFDQWFDRVPTRDRAAFCARAGLKDTRPFVLYVCSSLFKGGPPEVAFIRQWLRALRAADDPVVRNAAVLVRPHPQRAAEWDGVALEREYPDVSCFGSAPLDSASRGDYFDSMFHASAVVGLNTSALIESAIVDRPVFTVLLPEYRDHQEGTLHFRYLLDVGGGFLHVARSLHDHVRQLGTGLRESASARNDAFVAAFVRPFGRDVAATPRFVEAVESTAAVTCQPIEESAGVVARAMVGVLAVALRTSIGLAWLGDPRWAREAEGKAGARAERARRHAHKRREHRAMVWQRRRARVVAAVKTAIKAAAGMEVRRAPAEPPSVTDK
ncbi:MAG: hypothetical protein FJW23_10005 [Acidimicrobiia bacterium]|nr:hypothetical protein [Acidimicrobiia bacterium]